MRDVTKEEKDLNFLGLINSFTTRLCRSSSMATPRVKRCLYFLYLFMRNILLTTIESQEYRVNVLLVKRV